MYPGYPSPGYPSKASRVPLAGCRAEASGGVAGHGFRAAEGEKSPSNEEAKPVEPALARMGGRRVARQNEKSGAMPDGN